MPVILYGAGAYRRDNGNLPEIKLKNMFVEHATSSETGVILQARQGLSTKYSVGAGPVTGIFSQNNVFNGDVFCVSGGFLYRGTSAIGEILGPGPVSFAAGGIEELVVCSGGPLYKYDGSTLATIVFPDDDDVSSVVFHDGLYIATVKDTDKWYWSGILDAGSWDGLDFASAESRPDKLLDVKIVSDFIFLIGAESIERWANTGNADIPYSRVDASIIQRGALATEVCVGFSNELVFVADDGIVYKLSQGLERVSDNGIEERISESDNVKAFGFNYFGHSFYCLKLDMGSYLYDLSTGAWCEFTSYSRNNWQANCACNSGLVTYFGDDTEGHVMMFEGLTDDNLSVEKLFTALFPLPGKTVTVDNLTIEVNVGRTPILSGEGSDPVVEMRSSVDAGANWNDWRQAPLGAQGHYRARTRWTRCGTFDFPGGMFEIRLTDPVPFRISNVLINELSGGRSRGS